MAPRTLCHMCGCDSIVEDDGNFVCVECGAMQTRFRDEASEDSDAEQEAGRNRGRVSLEQVTSKRRSSKVTENRVQRVPIRQAIVREARVDLMLTAQNLIYDLVSQAATTAGVSPSGAVTEAIRLWYQYLDHASRVRNALFYRSENRVSSDDARIYDDDVEALIQKESKLPPAVLQDAILHIGIHRKRALTPSSRTATLGPSTTASELDIPALSPALLLALVWMSLVNLGVPIFPAELCSWVVDGPLRKWHPDMLSLITEKDFSQRCLVRKTSVARQFLAPCVGRLHGISSRATEQAACKLKALGLPVAEVSPFGALTRISEQLNMGKRSMALARSLLSFALKPERERIGEAVLKELNGLVRLSVPNSKWSKASHQVNWHEAQSLNPAFHHFALNFVVVASLYVAAATLKLLDATPPEKLTSLHHIRKETGQDRKRCSKKYAKYQRRLDKLQKKADPKSEAAQKSIRIYTKKLRRYAPKGRLDESALAFEVEGTGYDMHIKGLDVRWDAISSEAKQAFWAFCDDFAPRPQRLAGLPYPRGLTFEQALKKKRISAPTISEHAASFSATVRYDPLQRMNEECDRAKEVARNFNTETARQLTLDSFVTVLTESPNTIVRLSACSHLLLCAEELKVAILQYHDPKSTAARERVRAAAPVEEQRLEPSAAPIGSGSDPPTTGAQEDPDPVPLAAPQPPQPPPPLPLSTIPEEGALSGSVLLPIFDLSQRGALPAAAEHQEQREQGEAGQSMGDGPGVANSDAASSTSTKKRRRLSQKSKAAESASAPKKAKQSEQDDDGSDSIILKRRRKSNRHDSTR